jgi:hypothetical protein
MKLKQEELFIITTQEKYWVTFLSDANHLFHFWSSETIVSYVAQWWIKKYRTLILCTAWRAHCVAQE